MRGVSKNRGIEDQADEDRPEQGDAGKPQSRVGNPVEKPQQRGALERPADRDPLRLVLELQRENQGDEKQRGGAEPGEPIEAERRGAGNGLQQSEQTEQWRQGP